MFAIEQQVTDKIALLHLLFASEEGDMEMEEHENDGTVGGIENGALMLNGCWHARQTGV